eukprot:TRINITY_DN43142_c0_g1_i1.p1 TRINITY_DN43142_c0_g1~~TRINITY_DN43142_c0_g1_i1.p1  ORF type:complete len:458 (+),score=48.92 TRINITY_DN43142_c0_g1_i1:79-1452(+)
MLRVARVRPNFASIQRYSMSSGDKSFQNRQLAQKMKELAGNKQLQYRQFKQHAAAFRCGGMGNMELWSKFVNLFGCSREAEDLWVEMASLLPSHQQTSLLECLEYGVVDHEWTSTLNESEWIALSQDYMKYGEQEEASIQKSDTGKEIEYRETIDYEAMVENKPRKRKIQNEGHDKGGNVIVWLRQDLRLHDNPAIAAAASTAKKGGGIVYFVYIHSPYEDGESFKTGTFWQPGGASCVWMLYALQSFNQDLIRQYGVGAAIIYRNGPFLQSLQHLIDVTKAKYLYFNRRYEPAMLERDTSIVNTLQPMGICVETFNALLLREPWEVKLDLSNYSGMFGTLIPFYMACIKLGVNYKSLPKPNKLPVSLDDPRTMCHGLQIEALGLYKMPQKENGKYVDWASTIRDSWDFSESEGLRMLEDFIRSKLRNYETKRMLADRKSTRLNSSHITRSRMPSSA